jgi:D-3-phosphoglycerate dehydrogenase
VQVGILEADGFSGEAIGLLETLGPVSAYSGGSLEDFLAPLDALFVRLGYRIDDRMLAMAPKLKWLCSPTTGHNHIDEQHLAEKGVRLLSLRGERAFLETIRATPEHTFGLVLSLLRRYPRAISDVAAGVLDRDACRGEELFGNRVGIIGLGRVGYRVASYCSAFGASVAWCDPVVDLPAEASWQRLPDIRSVIEASRMVVLCASYQAGQAPIVGAAEIALLGGKYFVNTARGELVDESALLEAIGKDALAGVGIDVIANENGAHRLDAWRALLPGRNMVLTPHMGGATFGAMGRTESFIAEKLKAAVTKEDVSDSR